MRAPIFFLFLLTIHQQILASEWTKYSSTGSQDEYMDFEYLGNGKSKNNMLKAWQMIDYKTVIAHNAGIPVLSTKILYEVNCSQRMGRIAYIATYSEAMGNGPILKAWDPKSEFTPIVPSSLYDELRKTGCPP